MFDNFVITGSVIGLGVLTLLQIAPIKINPWSWIARQIGRAINGEVLSKVGELEARVDDNEADRLRADIVDFANSCRNNRRHTESEFKRIYEAYDKYEDILVRRHRKNGKIDADMAYIQEIYHTNQQNNTFFA